MSRLIDLSGQRFSRWTVVDLASQTNSDQAVWNCICDCGKSGLIPGSSLRRGLSSSCGCYSAERSSVHGFHGTPTYNSWSTMKQRCTNPSAPNYSEYGGQGITVVSEWDTFERFLQDMGKRPEGTTLDRVKNELGYSKSNCRWAPAEVQQNNKSNNVFVDYKGEAVSISTLAEKTGLNVGTLWNRYRKGKRGEDLHGPLLR